MAGLEFTSQPKSYSYLFPFKSHIFLRAYNAPDAGLSTLLPLSVLIFRAILGGSHYDFCSTDEQTEAQRDEGACPRSLSSLSRNENSAAVHLTAVLGCLRIRRCPSGGSLILDSCSPTWRRKGDGAVQQEAKGT